MCSACGRVVAVRPRNDEDPPLLPFNLSAREIDRLRFVQWRLGDDLGRNMLDGDGSPLTAA
ncbi:MAG: hypothetical protein DLM70_15055 [Chloroflexi bacterium]|nr:MAG: hypothetical protein DLM70_15055 [Chloroflexota bacterium]